MQPARSVIVVVGEAVPPVAQECGDISALAPPVVDVAGGGEVVQRRSRRSPMPTDAVVHRFRC